MFITTYWDTSHQAKLANHGTQFWLVLKKGHPVGTYWVYNPKTKTVILTKNMTFLQKSYRDWEKVEKLVVISKNYEGSFDDLELKMVPVINQNNNNYYNVVGVSKCNEKLKKTFLMRDYSWSWSNPLDHYQCKGGTSNEKSTRFILSWCQQNCQ